MFAIPSSTMGPCPRQIPQGTWQPTADLCQRCWVRVRAFPLEILKKAQTVHLYIVAIVIELLLNESLHHHVCDYPVTFHHCSCDCYFDTIYGGFHQMGVPLVIIQFDGRFPYL